MSASPLVDRHDALLVDLDGTVVLAGQPIDHAASVLEGVRARGTRVLIVTNNASRTPAAVAERLTRLGIPFLPEDVVSSPLAAAHLLSTAHRPGDRVLVVGTEALADAIAGAGLMPVRSVDQHPVAVVQGHNPDTGWRQLSEACLAIRAGADWVATNTDSTLPTDRGLLPGNGAMVQALVTATGRQPRVAGKPARPLLDAAAERAGARSPLVVGDRLDTDIAAAVAAGMPSLMVLTGVSSAADLLAAPADRRPTLLAADLRGLLDPGAVVKLDSSGRSPAATPGSGAPAGAAAWRIDESATHLVLAAPPGRADPHGGGSSDSAATATDALGVMAALAPVAWRTGVTEVCASDERTARALADLGLA